MRCKDTRLPACDRTAWLARECSVRVLTEAAIASTSAVSASIFVSTGATAEATFVSVAVAAEPVVVSTVTVAEAVLVSMATAAGAGAVPISVPLADAATAAPVVGGGKVGAVARYPVALSTVVARNRACSTRAKGCVRLRGMDNTSAKSIPAIITDI